MSRPLEFEVPPGADAHRCPECDEPQPSEETLVLHRGLEHYERLDGAEREAFRSAYEAERADLRSFQLQALLALVLIYFGFVLAYAAFA